MKRLLFACCMAAILASGGCTHTGSISPQERVVVNPEKTDFGLAGTWRVVPDDPLHRDKDCRASIARRGDVTRERDKDEFLTITRRDDGVYDAKMEVFGKTEIQLRAMTLDKEAQSAIVDVEALAQGKLQTRYLVVAKRDGDKLYVWWIESRNLAKAMHEEGYSAVIERESFTTKVFAKPDELLDCVRKHGRELIGRPAVLELVAK